MFRQTLNMILTSKEDLLIPVSFPDAILLRLKLLVFENQNSSDWDLTPSGVCPRDFSPMPSTKPLPRA
jgi:hypothetical protein